MSSLKVTTIAWRVLRGFEKCVDEQTGVLQIQGYTLYNVQAKLSSVVRVRVGRTKEGSERSQRGTAEKQG